VPIGSECNYTLTYELTDDRGMFAEERSMAPDGEWFDVAHSSAID
jgi:hypothetical protein